MNDTSNVVRRPRLVFHTGVLLALGAVTMFAVGYAMIPLYYQFCRWAGIPTARDGLIIDYPEVVAEGRPLRMEFITHTDDDILTMIPSLSLANMTTGQAYSVTYELRNRTNRTLIGTAVPSYAPARAGRWLNKIQCFCFWRTYPHAR